MSSKITREMRNRALEEDYKNKGKSDRNWYLIDGDIMEENYGIKSFTSEEGSVFIAVLERWEDPKFFMEIFVHYNIGSNNHAFLCPDKMVGDPCPVCDFREELKKQGEPEDIYNEYKWTRRYLMWVVNTETQRTINKGVFLYDAPMTVKNGILDVCADPRSGTIIDPSDVNENVNIVFKRIGKKGYRRTEYKGFKIEKREDSIPNEYFDLPEMKELLIQPDVLVMKKCLGLPVESSRRSISERETKSVEEKPAKRLSPQEIVGEDESKPRIPHKWNIDEVKVEEKGLITSDSSESEDADDAPFDAKKYGIRGTDENEEREKVIEKTRERLKSRERR